VIKIINRFWPNKKQPIHVDVLTGYAHWARHYPAQAHNPLMEVEEQAMLSLMPENMAGQTCLDLACGSGRYLRLMQTRCARVIFGSDYSPHMLAQATHSQFIIHNSQLTRSAFLALPFAAATFDFIVCGLAVGHEPNLRQTMAEIARVLRPGGTVIYSDFHPFGTLSGWQRSFTTPNGQALALEHHLHLYSHHHQACQAAGLIINAVLEPTLGALAPAGFERMPVVLVIRAEQKGTLSPRNQTQEA
jgi:malonyl-CoA O-methyltransferase